MSKIKELYEGSIWGLITADALGVPAEFKSRDEMKLNPITDMVGYGTHHQPKGTWSDDSSMMLCTLDSLADGYNPEDIIQKFLSWISKGDYTPYGNPFDCGISTYEAVCRYKTGRPVSRCGGRGVRDNGNGSLMRILPVVLMQYSKYNHFASDDFSGIAEPVHTVSALTHAHPISMIGCGLYAHILAAILRFAGGEAVHTSLCDELNASIEAAWSDYRTNKTGNLYGDGNFTDALEEYSRIRDARALRALPEDEIISGGYVVTTLEAALWCLLNTDNYADCVLKAVNLGRDTDTVAAVAGSLAGALYGKSAIPEKWLDCLARREWIDGIIDRFLAVM